MFKMESKNSDYSCMKHAVQLIILSVFLTSISFASDYQDSDSMQIRLVKKSGKRSVRMVKSDKESVKINLNEKLVSFSKEADEAVIKRIMSNVVLNNVKKNLQSFYNNRNKAALKNLLNAVDFEQRVFVKKDLADYTDVPSFEVNGTSLLIISKAGAVQFEVEDPIQGRFSINGKKIRIQGHMPYSDVKKKINYLSKDVSASTHPLLNLLLPEAHAIVPVVAGVAARAICVRYCASVAMTAANATTKAAANPGVRAALSKFFMHPWTMAVAGPMMGACFFTGGIMGNSCATPVKFVGCAVGVKNDSCVETAGDMQAKIVEKGDTVDSTTTVIEEVDGGKCKPYASGKNTTGFSKGIVMRTIRKTDVIKAKPDAPIPPAISISKFHLEYQPNPEEPDKLIIRSVTESIHSAQGTMIGQRIWTSDGANFKVVELNEFQLNTPEGMRSKAQPIACTQSTAKKPECQALIEHFKSLGNKINCAFDNSEAVVDKLKKETKDNKALDKKAGTSN
jgi:hypothetical protein